MQFMASWKYNILNEHFPPCTMKEVYKLKFPGKDKILSTVAYIL